MSRAGRWLRWIVPVLVVAVLAAFAMRTLHARKLQREAAMASASKPILMELAADDVVTAGTRELARTLEVSGGLRAVDSAVVKARVAGELRTLTVREGDRVKAGQVIGQIDTTELQWRVRQAEEAVTSARAQRDIARRALANNRQLVEQGFISSTGLETSVSNDAAAQANLAASETAVSLARKTLADARLVAPIGGFVSQRLVQPGERVAVEARIVEIVDLTRIELEAAMTPEDVVGVSIGQTAHVTVDGLPDPVEAKVARINPSTQPGTRAVMVYLSLAPQPRLRQGLFARGRIELQRSPARVVPTNVVRVDQARPYVLAVADGKVVQRTVALGRRGEAATKDGGRESVVEVLDGVGDGAVLLRGSVGLVRDGTPVRLAPAAAPASGPGA